MLKTKSVKSMSPRWGFHGRGHRRHVASNVPTLAFTPMGAVVEVVSINAGARLYSRLSELGIIPGERIHVVMNQNGYIVVELRGVRYGLSPGIASKIIVRPVAGV